MSLRQNYPNPFNPTTTIEYQTEKDGMVTVEVLDVAGRLVCSLVDDFQPAGRYSISWNGRNSEGQIVSSGIYFCRLNTPQGTRAMKMVLSR